MASCEENSTANDLKKFNLSVSDIAWINSCAKNEKSVEGWVGFSAWVWVGSFLKPLVILLMIEVAQFLSQLRSFSSNLGRGKQDGHEADDTKRTTADMTVFVSFLKHFDCSLYAFEVSFFDIKGGWSLPGWLVQNLLQQMICFSNNLNGHHKIEFDLARPKLKS
ncbi:hypothetical protein Cgig2_030251 [Carnegiea gigantea]|uniref:Uncharacterized protein n=1 Tax=Carnegiea gigantea TaxID=171969 RepID=A0A9Q1H148_9CARY|nr:hypothetical protein Cgig2_030251 [Carnegiea gigantea]